MDNIKIIKEFDQIVEKKFNDGVGEYIDTVKKAHNLTDEDITLFVGKNYCQSNPYKLEDMSGFEVMRLIELCNDAEQTVSLLKQYNDLKSVVPVEEKIKFVLDMFNVTDEESLNKLIDAIIDVRKSMAAVDEECCCKAAESDCEPSGKKHSDENECKCTHADEAQKADCHRKENRHKNNGCAKLKYSYYNSDTMDKPVEKTFNLDLDPDMYDSNLWKYGNLKEIQNLLKEIADEW